jgi:integrase
VPTVQEFAKTYVDASRLKNKASSITAKGQILRTHVLPALGHLRLDQVTYARIEDFKVSLASTRAGNAERRTDAPASGRCLSPKTINNVLTVLRRMLVVAKKRGLIENVPEVEWLKLTRPEVDFLSFEEADRLVDAAEGEWRTMVLVALRTGMRQGELLALRWQDVDLKAGRITVRQSVVRGNVGVPKSGKGREIALRNGAVAALKAHRHLRGPLVFCDQGGDMLTTGETKHPLWRACRRAQLRLVGWHALRHTFASHLVMRGAPLRVVQELLGHATMNMTLRYAHLSPEVARDAVKLLDRATPATIGQQMGSNSSKVS